MALVHLGSLRLRYYPEDFPLKFVSCLLQLFSGDRHTKTAPKRLLQKLPFQFVKTKISVF